MVGHQLGPDEQFLHRTCGGLFSTGGSKPYCPPLVLQIPFKCQNMYLYLRFVSASLRSIGLTLPWPFFSPSLRPVLMVPGYRQVSGRRKDLFCCFWISCFCTLPGEGVGWLHRSPSSTTGLTTLMWPRSAPLLSSAVGLFLTLCGMTFDVPFH